MGTRGNGVPIPSERVGTAFLHLQRKVKKLAKSRESNDFPIVNLKRNLCNFVSVPILASCFEVLGTAGQLVVS